MKNLSLLALLLLVAFSCNDDEIDQMVTSTQTLDIIADYNPNTEIVTGTIVGSVYDENEDPVEGAIVNYNGKTFSSDADGRFFIEDESLDRQGTFFTVEAEGFFKGSRRIYPSDGSVNYAYIQLLALDEIGSFDAATGGEIVGDDGLRITFSENSIQSSTGDLYTGEVTVAAKWLDPTASNINEIMPGDLLGLNASVEEVSLISYGMMAVELFDENGNNINIADENTATLSFPVPQELINEAPAEIPLWSFEEEQFGIWVEEGSATLQGDRYVGQVSHFSFWNCDVPSPLVYVEGQLVTEEGTPLPNTTICIDFDGSSSNRCGTTDNRGFFAGKMPQDRELNLRFGDQGQDCTFSSINLGSFSDDIDLGQIQVTESGAALTIRGSIVDCNNNPVNKGLIIFQIGDAQSEYYVGSDASFEIAVLNCDNASEIIFTAVDVDNLEVGIPQTLPIDPDIEFATLSACGNPLTEFITLNVNGQEATVVTNIGLSFADPDFIYNPALSVTSDSSGVDLPFTMRFFLKKGSIGTYGFGDVDFMEIFINEPAFNENAFTGCQTGAGCDVSPFEYTVTENGGENGFWAGEFSGTGIFRGLNGGSFEATYPFSGKFRVSLNP